MNIWERIESYEPYLLAVRRQIHANPELSTQEYETSRYIKDELTKYGIEWRSCGLETGILAVVRGAKDGKTILLRGDMDALPITEETGLPFASTREGVMHACGHDCHTSSLLTSARILQDMRDELCGTVVFAFQPAEETADGAKAMVADGALEGVDGCFAIHIDPSLDTGTFGCDAGPVMSAADYIEIRITGKGGHGSAPHVCVDSVIATAAIVQELQTVVSREIDPAKHACLTIGRMEAGDRSNIIGEHGYLEGSARYYEEEVHPQLKEAVTRIATLTAQSHRAAADVVYKQVIPPVINDAAMAELVGKAGEEALGPGSRIPRVISSGSEDFSFFMKKVPGCMARMGVRADGQEIVPLHSSCLIPDEKAIINSVKLYVQVALDFTSGK